MKKPKPKSQSAQKLCGTFRHLIFSPKGQIEGLMLKVGRAEVQIVLEPGQGEGLLEKQWEAGQRLSLTVEPAKQSKKGESAHPVYHLQQISGGGGKDVATTRSVSGIVERLNFAKHGEANGVVLSDGHFVHLKPKGMKSLGLRVGDEVVAKGEARRLAVGSGYVIEAREVNGRTIEAKGHSAER